jgi:hypothetical protein
MRQIFLILLLLCGAAQAGDGVRSYDLSYKGLQVGRATLADAVRLFGEPRSKKVNSNNVRYRFRDLDVTIKDESGMVDTLVIYDPVFRDVNGYVIGTDYADVARTTDIRKVKNTLFDRANGVVYWFKKGRVSAIVYLAKARAG